MPSHEMAIMTSRALRAVIAAVIVALTITACGISGPDPAACKAAMQAQYVKAKAGQGHFGAAPAACTGLPKAEVQRFAQQVVEGK
jgi:predicted small lipoprotein YifL